MSDTPLISVVVPAYNEAEVIDAFYERATSAMSSVEGFDYELIFVNDGSRDGTQEKLAHFAATDPRVSVLKFSRNFGHQIAISAGIDFARGDCVAVIDADLQDPPEVIGEMALKWKEGYDVVYGVREKRKGEGRLKLWTAAAYYRLLSRIVKIEIPLDVGDFRLMSRRATDELKKLREKDRFVRGLVSWIGFNQIGVTYERDSRFAGETKYPWRKMIQFALDGVTSFSTMPLRLATWLGYFASAFAFIYLAYVFAQRFLGFTVQGWATTMVGMLFLGGVQLICLGIIGEYLGRIFNEIKPRPMYIVEEALIGELSASSQPSEPVGR